MLAHADETDNSHAPSRTHPGCAVVPAALAIAEHTHASGEKFLRAVVLGYDICARVNLALGADAAGGGLPQHPQHRRRVRRRRRRRSAASSSTPRRFATCSHIARSRPRALPATCAIVDHIEKAFDFGGMPARNGVAAATMVAHGFTGVDDVFSGERNFFDAYGGDPDPAQLADALGERFEILGDQHQEMVGRFARAGRARCARRI